MSVATPAQIQFLNFVVKESHIVFTEPGQFKIAVNFDPKGAIFKQLGQFHLTLNITVQDEEDKFRIDLQTISIFSFDPSADIEQLRSGLFATNAPSIVFPYLRAYITALTALSGMPTLTLPTFNLTGLSELLKTSITIIEE